VRRLNTILFDSGTEKPAHPRPGSPVDGLSAGLWEQWKTRYAKLRKAIFQMVVLELGRSTA